MNFTKIIVKTYELVDVIKKSDTYKNYLSYEFEVLNNKDLKQLLSEFKIKKEKFEEAYKHKDYYPEIDKIKDEYQSIKINLMNNSIFKSYKASEKELDFYINEIENKLKQVVNLKEKHDKSNIRLI